MLTVFVVTLATLAAGCALVAVAVVTRGDER